MTLSQQLQSAVNTWVKSEGQEEKEAAVHALLNEPIGRTEGLDFQNLSIIDIAELRRLSSLT